MQIKLKYQLETTDRSKSAGELLAEPVQPSNSIQLNQPEIPNHPNNCEYR